MSRTISTALGSDSPVKATFVAKAALSNSKLTRKENQRELRHDTMDVSLVVDPNKFLEFFVPEPSLLPGQKARRKPSNPFTKIEKPTSEKKMYEDYPKLLNKITRGSEYAFVATPYKADDTINSKLAVDCGMYHRTRMPKKEQMKGMDAEARKDFRRVCWSKIDLPAECKVEDDPFEDSVGSGRPFSDKRKDACGQALSYVELTYHHQHRTFVFMVIFIGIHCRLLRVDRSGLFVTKRFNITTTSYLVEFLWRYTQLSPEDRGYDMTAEPIDPRAEYGLAKMMKDRLSEVEEPWNEEDAEEDGGEDEEQDREEKHIVDLWRDALNINWPWSKLRIPDEVMGKDRWFVVGKPSFQAPGVRGRGTRCYIAIELFVRDRDEFELDTKFVFLKDCWRVFVDGAADEALDIQKEEDTLKKLNDARIEHVPTLVAHGDIEGQDTKATPKAWKTVNDKHRCRLKTHQHYRLVVEEIGRPLSEFENSGELLSALHDCLTAHRDAMNIHIIHRDISGGNILLYRKDNGPWRGMLTDWELSKDTSIVSTPRLVGRTGTLQFSAARVLDEQGKLITAADEIECVFHVLIYYAVRFLHHNLPDKSVAGFLHNYFDACTVNVKGELAAPTLKRTSMTNGSIKLNDFKVKDSLRFVWVDTEEPQGEGQDAGPAANVVAAAPDYDHPLNELIETLLSWFSALYLLDELRDKPSAMGTSTSSVPLPPRRGKPVKAASRFNLIEGLEASTTKTSQSKEELEKLAAHLDGHAHVLALFQRICLGSFPMDKGKDKRPEKGYTPCSPETPELSELPSSSDAEERDDNQMERGAAVPDALSPEDSVQLVATADRGRDERRAPAVPVALNLDELKYHDDNSRSPSPSPVRQRRASARQKRSREDDAGCEDAASGKEGTVSRTSGKRSRC